MGEASEVEGETSPGPEYTIDELAASSGVPSRTIRFYQAKGLLPAPRRRGRVAVYDDAHAERLRVVAELQDKGLRLRAIRELMSRPDVDSQAINKWLGVGEQLGAWSQDAPQLLSEDELRRLLGTPAPGTIGRLIRRGAVQPHGEGTAARYLVESPALVQLAMRLEASGIDLDVAMGLYDILQKRLSQAAKEVVDYAMGHLGKGFGKTSDPDDVMRAVQTLFPDGACGDAVRIVFTREIDAAVNVALKGQKEGDRKRRRR